MGRRPPRGLPLGPLLLVLATSVACTGPGSTAPSVDGPSVTVSLAGGACARYVSPTGDDHAVGSRNAPWATIQHASEAVPDQACTVWIADGTYRSPTEIDRTFATRTVFRAIHPYHAEFVSDGSALDLGGNARNMVFTGLQFRQTGPGASGVMVYVSGNDTGTEAPSDITFTNDVFHDSWGDDLMKIRGRSHAIVVRDNIFYNQSDQGQGEQHIDVNSASDVTIEDNVFFNDFAASGRPDDHVSQHFIVVKDSGGIADGQLGSLNVTIARNVFLHYEGSKASMIAIGNDGKPYYEAQHVTIADNLMLGDGPDELYAALTINGASDVSFLNNTVAGDLPSEYYAVEIGQKGQNPQNQQITLANNIWCDPTGTMSTVSGGSPSAISGLTFDRNLYWNAGNAIDPGALIGSLSSPNGLVGDPGLRAKEASIALPWWNGTGFASGDQTVRDAFVRIVSTYGAIPGVSPAVGAADPALAPPTDILGRPRGSTPDIGAFETAN